MTGDGGAPPAVGGLPPRISVVVPAFNAAATIGACLTSVEAQTLPPAEVIVVDDGSSDATVAVVEEHHPWARVVRQRNTGPSGARNRGLAEADGGWVAFLDADDRWHPHKLAAQVAALAHRPDAVLVATDWRRPLAVPLATPGGEGGEPATGQPPGWVSPATPSETVFGYRDLLVLNRFQTSTVLMSRQVAHELGGFDGALDGVEDWHLWLRAAAVGPIVKLDWPYVEYRDVASGYSKDLDRVYATLRSMLVTELAREDLGPQQDLAAVLAWHHLRFALGFLLEHQPGSALRALGNLRAEGLVGATPTAVSRYMAPFLAGRLRRRIDRPSRRDAPASAA
ncbi:MAG TPA: glycosyltransferase [Acidimicrobiales bacterium]|nr:glycosyltransferase [Acidimicrobiales bacterium]